MSAAGSDLDAELLRRMAGGDESALKTLWARHAPAVHGYLRTLCDDEMMAEELLQDTFTAAWKAAGAFSGRAAARTWLFAIARRRARDRRRALRLDLASEDRLATLPQPGPSTEDAALGRIALAELVESIRRLGPAHREVLALSFSHQLSHTEIADLLGIPVGTVKSRIDAARRALIALVNR